MLSAIVLLARLVLAAGLVGAAPVMPSLRWRVSVNKPKAGRKAYQLRIAPPVGSGQRVRWVSSGTEDRAEAERLAAAREAELNAGLQAGGLSVAEVCQAYADRQDSLHRAGQRALRTAENAQLAAKVAAEAFGRLLAADLSAAAVERARDLLLERVRASTWGTYLRQWRSGWRWARREGLVHVDWPEIPRLTGAAQAGRTTEKRPLTPQQLARLTAAVSEQWALPVHLLLELGPRPSEVAALDAQDVVEDEDGRCWLLIRRTKTGRSRRLPLLADTAASLIAHLAGRTTGPLFPGRRGRISRGGLGKAVTDALGAARLRRPLGPRGGGGQRWDLDAASLRRAWIAHASRAGVPDPIARRIVGHEEVGVHNGYQRHYEGDDLHAAVARVREWRGEQVRGGLRRADSVGYKSLVGTSTGPSGRSCARRVSADAPEASADVPHCRTAHERRAVLHALATDPELRRVVLESLGLERPGSATRTGRENTGNGHAESGASMPADTG